jgi:hypothetical protein
MMATKAAHTSPLFKKELKALQDKWPGVRITAQDRLRWNKYMQTANQKARLKKKRERRKKPVAT